MEKDDLLDEAIQYAKQKGRIKSTSLQLKFLIGYTRANRLMAQMEEFGVFTNENFGKYYIDRIVIP